MIRQQLTCKLAPDLTISIKHGHDESWLQCPGFKRWAGDVVESAGSEIKSSSYLCHPPIKYLLVKCMKKNLSPKKEISQLWWKSCELFPLSSTLRNALSIKSSKPGNECRLQSVDNLFTKFLWSRRRPSHFFKFSWWI